MKASLDLNIEKHVLVEMKKYARDNGIDLSELVELYFMKMLNTANKKTIIDLVEELDKPVMEVDVDLKKMYYEKKGLFPDL